VTELLGQEAAERELATARRRDRLHHALLFEGRPGTGRATFARALGAAVLCETDADTACGACASCRLLAAGRHPDWLEIPRGGATLQKSALTGSGPTPPEHPPLLPFLRLRPQAGSRRVCLLPDAERMNDAAANAFLKGLEEPPPGTLLLLTTAARDRLLRTIVSRCRRVGVRPLSAETIRAELLRRGAAAEAEAGPLALAAEGSLGAALALAAGETLEAWRWTGTALRTRTPAGAVALGEGWIERARAAGGSAAERRAAAARLLDLAALEVRRRLREGLAPGAASAALEALWAGAERLAANVRMELALHAAALDTVAALRSG
jgi:DNA polymerase-3 subunit delta'